MKPTRILAAALLFGPLLAGCNAAASADPPDPTPSAYTTTFYTGLAAKCPVLSSPSAAEFGVDGPGQVTPDHRGGTPDTVIADCVWTPDGTEKTGAGDGTSGADKTGAASGADEAGTGALTVSVRMSVHRSPERAAAEWQMVSAGQDRRMLEVGEEAYSAVEMPATVVRARSGTAVATIRFSVPEEAATEEHFEELRPAFTEISQDILDDLV